MTPFAHWQQGLAATLTRQASLGLLRQRKLAHIDSTHAEPPLAEVDFSSNDYLGLARDSDIAAALAKGVAVFGHGSTASPLISGYSQAHLELEQRLCMTAGQDAALLFCSGFSANVSLFKTLFTARDVIVADKLMHASALDGIADSGAKLVRFTHNDVASAKTQLQRLAEKGTPATALVTESVFSMDGDEAPLAELKQLATQYGCGLIVDDAHGFGWRPLAVVPDIHLITFGKALGGQGAAILSQNTVIDYLVSHSRAYIYSTALSPASCMAVSVAVTKAKESSLVAKLRANIAYFQEKTKELGIAIMVSNSPIQGVLTYDIQATMALAAALGTQGLKVGAIRPPTVPKGLCRLRITLSAAHQHTDIDRLLTSLSHLLAQEANHLNAVS